MGFQSGAISECVPVLSRFSGEESLFLFNNWIRLETYKNLGIYPDILESQ